MTALDDHYTTLSNNKTERKNEIEKETKIENTNNRKAEYEEEEGNKVAIVGYYVGIVYYILWIISFVFFIYDKMYKSFWSSVWILFMLFLPYLLYVYFIPHIIKIFDFVFTNLIPKNTYYGITKS
tara:strand:- start:8591 stop:8965 length:375 start_codon:yes stop_codon:yes gene_type:complete